MEPLDDRWWLAEPDELDEDERADRERRLDEDADTWYKEQQDAATHSGDFRGS